MSNIRKTMSSDDYWRSVVKIHADAVRTLRDACKESLPWLAIATAELPERHPQAIQNAKDDLARMQAALEATKEFDQ